MRWARALILVVLSFAARFYALANPDTTNSDCAVVALQAMHVLRGEWGPFLWGSAYQTSVDSTVAAGFFALFGATPLALMISALALHAALTVLAYAMLARAIDERRALLLALLLVFTGAAIHSYALYPPRQAALTIGFAALFALDRGGVRGLAVGAALAAFSLFADPYALLLVPGAGVLALFAIAAAPAARARVRHAIAALIGGAIGAVPLALLVHQPSWKSGVTGLSLDVFARNVRLLFETCGPWAFGTTVYRPETALVYLPWSAPLVVRAIQLAGGLLLAASCFVAPLAAFDRRTSAGARRLGLAGAAITWSTLAGFVTSVMVMDHFSMRYLAAALLAAPLALAPVAERLSLRALGAALAPMLASGFIGGFASTRAFADGFDVASLGGRADEREVMAELERRGIRAGVADYWVAYRLTFLAKERIVVVPGHAAQDRYPPYRRTVAQVDRHAVVFDAFRSEEPRASIEARLRAAGTLEDVVAGNAGRVVAFIVRGPVARSD